MTYDELDVGQSARRHTAAQLLSAGKACAFCFLIFIPGMSMVIHPAIAAEHMEADDCNTPESPVKRIICSDPELSISDQRLRSLLVEKSATLDARSATTLAEHQKRWLMGLKCVTFSLKPNFNADPRVRGARACIIEAYTKRKAFLTELPTDVTPHAPYVLSGFERAMLADGALSFHSDLSYDLNGAHGELLQTSLNRVIAAVIAPGPDANGASVSRLATFDKAATGLATDYQIDENRYLFGSACQRHACFHEGAMVVDLHSGEVVLADRMPPNHLVIMSNACAGQAIRQYATRRLREWADEAAMRQFGRTSTLTVKLVESGTCE